MLIIVYAGGLFAHLDKKYITSNIIAESLFFVSRKLCGNPHLLLTQFNTNIFYVQRCPKLINFNFHHRPLDMDYQLARDRRELTARMRGWEKG